jgi:DnaK suppressor protein
LLYFRVDIPSGIKHHVRQEGEKNMDVETRKGKFEAISMERSSDVRKLRQELAELIAGHNDFDNASATAEQDLIVFRLNRYYIDTLSMRAAESELGELGAYTECAGCDGTIEEKRFQAIPWARFCTGCQERQDREQREELSAA